jgi:mannose-6-phosphate isomerase
MTEVGFYDLGPNQIRRFYRGGRRIAAFRGLLVSDDEAPEDWVASTTAVHGEEELGLSRLEDGTRLVDALARDPAAFFDPAHREMFGSDPRILIKLLDAGERLPVHFHPDDGFAARSLDSPQGKTEAWIILEAEVGASVHVGFARDIGEAELVEMVIAQDADALLADMNPLSVQAGDSIFVPAGLPHAIGEGILLLELQQPSDLSLLLEWHGMSQADALLGLERDAALAALTRSRVSALELEQLRDGRGASLFRREADRFFRAELISGGARLEASYSVLVCYAGEGVLASESCDPIVVRRGSTVLVPFAAGVTHLTGSCEAIRCLPPGPRVFPQSPVGRDSAR